MKYNSQLASLERITRLNNLRSLFNKANPKNKTDKVESIKQMVEYGQPLLYITDNDGCGSSSMMNLGMGTCSTCLNIMSIDNSHCKRCGEEKFIINKPK